MVAWDNKPVTRGCLRFLIQPGGGSWAGVVGVMPTLKATSLFQYATAGYADRDIAGGYVSAGMRLLATIISIASAIPSRSRFFGSPVLARSTRNAFFRDLTSWAYRSL